MTRFALTITMLAALGCQGAEECKSWSGSVGGTSWGHCGDKKERKVECDSQPRATGPTTPLPTKCTCTVDGIVGKTFQTTDPIKLATIESATSIANEQCGWHVSR